MPISALIFYMFSKYEHEMNRRIDAMKREAYLFDCLYSINLALSSRKYLELPRWHEFISKTDGNGRKQEEVSEQRVIDMFRGKGKLE